MGVYLSVLVLVPHLTHILIMPKVLYSFCGFFLKNFGCFRGYMGVCFVYKGVCLSVVVCN